MNDNTFIDALKVPAVISTVRKIFCDSGNSLAVLCTYHRRNRGSRNAPLASWEKAALNDVWTNGAEQTLTAIALFFAASGAYCIGGVVLGQIAQVLISANAMAAPRKQYVHPGRWLLNFLRDEVGDPLPEIPEKFQPRVACLLGQIAEILGYGAELSVYPKLGDAS